MKKGGIESAGRTPVADPEPDPREIAKTLDQIERTLTKLVAGGLNRKAIVALLHDYSKVSKRTIVEVLDGLEELRATYTVPPPKRRGRLKTA